MKNLLWMLLLTALPVAAQVPDDEDIVDRITTASSPYYYPNLLLRYGAGDTTLTANDYHYLYYGYAYRDEYKPLDPNPDLDRALLIASGLDLNKPRIEDLEALITAGFDALERDPFNLKMLNIMAYAYGSLGETEREASYFDRLNKVIATIEASGDGLTERTARHILMFDHAIDALAAADMPTGKGRIISRTTEFVPLTTPAIIDDRKVKGYYFDFNRVYRNKPEGYTYKRDRTWQFNNLKPKEYK